MKVVRGFVIAIALCFVVLLVVAFFLPGTFSVESSAIVAAPATELYARFATPRTWARWSAWTTEADPTLAYTYTGPDSGVGAVMKWTSKKMGNGQLAIVEAMPAQMVSYELSMTGTDMTVHGHVMFEPAADGTKVTWRDTGSLGKNVMLRYLRPVLDKSLHEAYAKSFAKLQREARGE
jgi:hypothetical protein